MIPPVQALPRSRNAAATREAILASARKHFARENYENVGLREIAGEVYENTKMLGGEDEVCFSVEEFSKLPPAIQTLLIDRAVQSLSGKTTYLNFEHYL
ncbi:MAG: hypothetical protein IH998_06825, partial [Proteobacteria bacterium]|nr:hypothetical protein [Pseudomonadota bacterium]